MNPTLEALNKLLTEEHMNMPLEDIAIDYQMTLNPSLLAAAFNKLYKQILNIAKNYRGLTEADVISYSLERLDMCLRTFISGTGKFITYFTKVLMNHFRYETQKLSTQKRKALFYEDSYEIMVEEGYEVAASVLDDSQLYEKLENLELTDRELNYCKLIVEEYSNQEIATTMKVSIMTLSNIRKKLRLKLAPLL